MDMLKFFALLLCGFSIFSGMILAATQIYRRDGWYFGWILVVAILVLQISHAWLFTTSELPSEKLYVAALYLIAPAFYLFVRAQVDIEQSSQSWVFSLHFLPMILAFIVPERMAMPLAFLIGGAYLIWLFRLLGRVREQREAFYHEAALLLAALLLGVGVFVLGLAIPLLDQPLFHLYYSIGIGGVFFLVHWALLRNPQLPDEVSEYAQQAYEKSTLVQVNIQEKLKQLDQLMADEQVFCQSDLKLAGLAEQLGVSAHQLSELVNAHRGMHFSRFLRQHRVEAAKSVLLAKPALSVLEVGLQVGFSSQSNFYEAFKEVTGTTPARFRKINL